MKKHKRFLLLSVAVIVSVTAVFGPGIFNSVSDTMSERRCGKNLSILHEALTRYLDDHDGVWPQGPAPDEAGWAEFWISALKPYGVDEEHWICPTESAAERAVGGNRRLHYVPTMFDGKPWTAMRWKSQPWLIERMNAHGKGPLICFPDGSIQDYETVRQTLGE